MKEKSCENAGELKKEVATTSKNISSQRVFKREN